MDHKLNNYIRNLLFKENKYISDFPLVIIRNCDDEGVMVTFNTAAENKRQNKPYWLLLKPLHLKKILNIFFCINQCFHCEFMKGVESLKTSQSEDNIRALECIHSQALSKVIFKRCHANDA